MHNNSAKMHNNKNGKQSLVSNGSPITIKPMANGYKNGHSNGYSHHIDDDFIKDVSQTDKCALHPCLVILASATINGIIFGVVNSFGVLYVYLIDKFKDRSITRLYFTKLWLTKPRIYCTCLYRFHYHCLLHHSIDLNHKIPLLFSFFLSFDSLSLFLFLYLNQ